MNHYIRFFIVPNELSRKTTRISIRNHKKNLIGYIIWDKRRNEAEFNPVSGYSLSAQSVLKIYELMQSIESSFPELTEQLIEESQVKTKVDSNASSAVI